MNATLRNLLLACSVTAALTACTSLSSFQDQRPATKTAALQGVRYSLPMRQYDIEITRALEKCEAQLGKKTADDVKLSMSASVTPRDVAGESFILDYTALSGWTKTTSVAIETYDNGVLKSINASADDRTAEVLSATAKTGFGLAGIAGGYPLPAGPADFENQTDAQKAWFRAKNKAHMLVCTDQAKDALKEIARLKNEVKTEAGKLESLTAKISTLAKRQPVYGLTKDEKERLSALLDEQDDLMATIETLQGQLQKAQDKVRFTSVVQWPRTVGDEYDNLSADSQALLKFAELLKLSYEDTSSNATQNGCGMFLTLDECIEEKLMASARLIPLTSADTPFASSDRLVESTSLTGQEGLYIRPPAPGVLLICKSGLQNCHDRNRDYLYRSDAELIPQLGHLQFLPFKNEAFRNNVIALSLRTNGTIEKLEYKTLKAAGEVMANLGTDVVDQWSAYVTAREKAQEDEAAATNKAELDALDQQINLLTKQQQLNALKAPPNDELTSLQADTTMTEARTRLLEAQAAERRAREALAKEDS